MMFQLVLDGGTGALPTTSGGGTFFVPLVIFGGLILLTLVLLGLMGWRRRPEMIGMTPERVREQWQGIVKTSDQGVMGAKISIMEADKLLDHVMKSMMIPGDTMGERLKTGQYKYPDLRNVWPAHKLRNQLVHDAAFEITTGAAKRALRDFEAALKALKVL
jgi:hypothetical protein